jgi:GLPGLI family protein
MKNSIQIIGLFLFTMSINAQNIISGTITYDIPQVYLENKSKNTDIANMLETAKEQQYQVRFNKNYSSFMMAAVMDNEVYNEFYNTLAKSFVSYADIYIDYRNNNLVEVLADGTLLNGEIPKIAWQITSDSKMIDNYSCYKATYTYDIVDRTKKITTRVVTAWFAPSLPYSFGPKHYQGLPGLILELTDHSVTFLVSKIELFESEVEINFPKGKMISKAEFENAVLGK